MKEGFMKCPFCANEIKEGAIKCQYCKEFLNGSEGNHTNKKGSKKYRKIILRCVIGIAIIALGCVIFEGSKHINLKNQINNDVENIENQIESDEEYSYEDRFPGFDEDDIKRLLEIADSTGVTGSKYDELLDELYQFYYPQVKEKHEQDEALLNQDNDNHKNEDTVKLKDGWTMYDNGEISFQYPKGLKVSESNFTSLSYFNGINIHIRKFNYNSYLDWLSDDLGPWAYDLSEKELKDYKNQLNIKNRDILTSVRNGTRNGEKLCTYGCSYTAGAIGSKKVSINGINGIINNYYFTQDPELACFTEINTEVLLVKDENTIYSIMFKYNFGDAYTFMYPYKTSSDEICIYRTYPSLASSWNSDIEGFFGYTINSLQGKDVAPFEKTYNKIIEMIDTIRFK